MIKLKDCKDAHLYKCESGFAIYDGKSRKFVVITERFGETSLEAELHHESNTKYGVVSPIEEIEKIPEEFIETVKMINLEPSTDPKLLNYLRMQKK